MFGVIKIQTISQNRGGVKKNNNNLNLANDICTYFLIMITKGKKMSSNIARGDISRAGIIIHSMTLLRALLERGYYSREGLI